ncbi:hypothetical protein EVAR_68856_1 [Eumeta japonica]|uniref:Uncharacterized protein n=1 Tax=Eumeta variegata TaxID=151549 RepID=A0A4C1TR80_EUMVA|nr:hypothetical protein EVAR_68856_1 [Eumeta japonica]
MTPVVRGRVYVSPAGTNSSVESKDMRFNPRQTEAERITRAARRAAGTNTIKLPFGGRYGYAAARRPAARRGATRAPASLRAG